MSEYEGVEDTLFIPLTARVNVSKSFPEYFFDQKALKTDEDNPDLLFGIAFISSVLSKPVDVLNYLDI